MPHCDYGAHSVSVSYSDDFGKTWAPLYVERRTPPWIGGYPDITVDTNMASPNFGVVYVAYNWLADAEAGPGLAVLASADGGRSWQIAQVARVGLSGYPAAWRIDYRVRTAPDGSAYVAFYEEDMRQWNRPRSLRLGRARQRGAGRLRRGPPPLRPSRSQPDLRSRGLGDHPGPQRLHRGCGPRHRGRSTPCGPIPSGRWASTSTSRTDACSSRSPTTLPASPPVMPTASSTSGTATTAPTGIGAPFRPCHSIAGLPQSAFKPTLAVRDGVVFVGFHGLTDVEKGTSAPGHRRHLLRGLVRRRR